MDLHQYIVKQRSRISFKPLKEAEEEGESRFNNDLRSPRLQVLIQLPEDTDS